METIDTLGESGLKICQAKNGYRFSLDAVLLGDFARVKAGSLVADLGTGNGVIPLLLAAKSESIRCVGFELQASLAERALRNVSLNDLEDRIDIIQGDVKNIQHLYPPQRFAVVVANPPFRTPTSGKVASRDERCHARHEISGSLTDFLSAAAYLLRNRGALFVVHLPERLVDLLSGMRVHGMEPKRLRFVHSRPGEEAQLVLVEAGRMGRPGLVVEPALNVYDGEGYSQAIKGIYAGFGSGPT